MPDGAGRLPVRAVAGWLNAAPTPMILPMRWRDQILAMREALRKAGALYGGRDLVSVLRPKFVTTAEYATLGYISGVIMQAARRLAERILDSPELRAFVGLSEGEAMNTPRSPLNTSRL